MSKATAPGFDMMTNNVLQCLLKKFEYMYLDVFNLCVKNSYFPIEWKKAKIILIPKVATDKNSVKTFRRIFLTSNFSKLFEKIILARLSHYLYLSNFMGENQHTYNKGRSTETTLFDMFDTV